MGQGKKALWLVVFMVLSLSMTSCGSDYWNPKHWFDTDTGDSSTSEPSASGETATATFTYSIAMGGVAEGRDELLIYNNTEEIVDFSDHSLTFETDNANITLSVRDGFADYMSGSGAKIIPQKVGTTMVSYFVDGAEAEDKFKVIVPPQTLIQILMGEARGQIEGEAQLENGLVALTSESPTGNAIAYVVKNRVDLISAGQPFSLFVVDGNSWGIDPPSSYWDAVITAESSDIYQFSPVDPSTESHEIYLASAFRADLTQEEDLVAYDQAVLTSAKIFALDALDPTGGAFAFRTPTLGQVECLLDTMYRKLTYLPPECGPGDENYPAFAPVQVLLHPSVALLDDGRPSFIFYRNRTEDEPAVTNAP